MSSGSEAGAQFDAAEQTFGGVDVVVNGNGIMKTDPLAQAGGGDYEKHFAVNVEGMFNTLRAHESLFEQRTGQDAPWRNPRLYANC